jgi:hypothetical protein
VAWTDYGGEATPFGGLQSTDDASSQPDFLRATITSLISYYLSLCCELGGHPCSGGPQSTFSKDLASPQPNFLRTTLIFPITNYILCFELGGHPSYARSGLPKLALALLHHSQSQGISRSFLPTAFNSYVCIHSTQAIKLKEWQ